MTIEPAITVQSLSKSYKLYRSRYDRIKELVHPFRKKYHQKFAALNDVSIKVERGEVLGIIGKNGSGKSTLLKILTSVVTQTSGSYNCAGRVTALLELGGGFNKELTGVENIYFLGAIQGYSKKDMSLRLEKILDFADIGEYAYQPVNTYSSGMYIRLAFSISMNIDPDILIIDEALAVGDIRFQQKCYRRFREFKEQQKTIVFCTHSLSAVKDFCSRAIWLHEGKVMCEGDPVQVTDSYSAFMSAIKKPFIEKDDNSIPSSLKLLSEIVPKEFHHLNWFDLSICESYGTSDAKILYAALLDRDSNQSIDIFKGGESVKAILYIKAENKIINPDIHLVLTGQYGSAVFKLSSTQYREKLILKLDKPNLIRITFTFPHIGNGRYFFSAGLMSGEKGIKQFIHYVHDAFLVEVFNPDQRYKQGSQLILESANFECIGTKNN